MSAAATGLHLAMPGNGEVAKYKPISLGLLTFAALYLLTTTLHRI
ncbi:MAG: hypothetical protein R6X02_22515 [Enhygromyxa sp.]